MPLSNLPSIAVDGAERSAEAGMATSALSQSIAIPVEPEIPAQTHRWNLWVAGSEAAIFMTASDMMGPMTLIPFLFVRTGIDNAWIGLFTVSSLLNAFGSPIGSALAGGRQRKLPFCVRIGTIQRLAYVVIPLGVTFFFDRPLVLLALLVSAWTISNFLGGVGAPLYQFIVTNSTWESWWGRMWSLRSILGAIAGLASTAFVWWVNRAFTAPHNYEIIGWLGVALLFVSLYGVSRIREVTVRPDQSHGPEKLSVALRKMGLILRNDGRLRWLVFAQVWRSCGFLLGAYMTVLLIQRCGLHDRDMWIPVLISTLPAILSHIVAGLIIDRFGAKPALVLSSFLVAINSILILYCYSIPSFIVLFISGNFGGSLLMNAWPTLLMKLAPREQRPAYFSAISLATAPGNVLVMLIGILLVRFTGYEYVFYLSAFGGFLSTALFFLKLPNIRQAPSS